MAPIYNWIPALTQWERDTAMPDGVPRDGRRPALAPRQNDVILKNIDKLLKEYEQSKDEYKGRVIACNLFFTVDYWLKTCKTDTRIEKWREPAVNALYKAVVANLCGFFGCTPNVLPRELELMFGRELTSQGVGVDIVDRAARYWTRADADQFKLFVRNGKVYQYPWWEKPPTKALVLAESSRSASNRVEGDAPGFKKYSGFVMSMSRDLYMAKHKAGMADPILDASGIQVGWAGKQTGVYHSAYLAGGPAMFAGTMRIEAGVITGVRSDSGHYQPGDPNTVSLLRALQMLGLNVDTIEVWDFTGTNESTAGDYFVSAGDWDALVAQRAKNQIDNKKAYEKKPFGAPNPKVPNPVRGTGAEQVTPGPEYNGPLRIHGDIKQLKSGVHFKIRDK